MASAPRSLSPLSPASSHLPRLSLLVPHSVLLLSAPTSRIPLSPALPYAGLLVFFPLARSSYTPRRVPALRSLSPLSPVAAPLPPSHSPIPLPARSPLIPPTPSHSSLPGPAPRATPPFASLCLRYVTKQMRIGHVQFYQIQFGAPLTRQSFI